MPFIISYISIGSFYSKRQCMATDNLFLRRFYLVCYQGTQNPLKILSRWHTIDRNPKERLEYRQNAAAVVCGPPRRQLVTTSRLRVCVLRSQDKRAVWGRTKSSVHTLSTLQSVTIPGFGVCGRTQVRSDDNGAYSLLYSCTRCCVQRLLHLTCPRNLVCCWSHFHSLYATGRPLK